MRLADFHRLVHDVEARKASVPARSGQPGGEMDAGRLPGTVGPEESDQLTGLHLEGDVIDGQHLAVVFGEVLNVNRGRRHVRLWCRDSM